MLKKLRMAMEGIRVPMASMSSATGALAAARRRLSTFFFHFASRRISVTSSLPSFSSTTTGPLALIQKLKYPYLIHRHYCYLICGHRKGSNGSRLR
jgi:hypothetical protein